MTTPVQIPAIPASVDPSIRRAFESVRLALQQVRTGVYTGLSMTDLLNAGLTPVGGKIIDPAALKSTPPKPVNVQATGGFQTILISWDDPAYVFLAFAAVFRSTVNDFGTAVEVGSTVSSMYSDTPPIASMSVTYYYWVKLISTAGIESPLSDVVSGSTANNPAYLLEVLTGQLTESQLYGALTSRINLIDTPATGLVAQVADAQGRLDSVVNQLNTLTINPYDAGVSYVVGNSVRYLTNVYECILATTGNLPTNATYWQLVGAYAGDIAIQVAANATAAAGSAGAAATSAGTAASKATEAGNEAAAALASQVSATSSMNAAAGSAGAAVISANAASTSASAASTSATAAGLSATSASGSATIATTASGNASTYAGQASSSKDSAAGSAVTAGNFATAAAASATAAGGSATAAASSASTASTSSGAAGTSAAASNASALAAVSSAAEAFTYKNNAASSATDAAGHATAAAIDYSAITARLNNVGGAGVSVEVVSQANASDITGLEGKYAVKVDANGYVAGFGLAVDTNLAGVSTSEFAIVADRFSIAPVATNSAAADGSPFFCLTAPQSINGVVIPAGVYMKSAFIAAATIISAQIKDLATDKLVAGSALIGSALIANAAITNAKIGDIIESSNPPFISMQQGWRINKAGSCEFNNGIFRGVVQFLGASSGFGNITDVPANVKALTGAEPILNSLVSVGGRNLFTDPTRTGIGNYNFVAVTVLAPSKVPLAPTIRVASLAGGDSYTQIGNFLIEAGTPYIVSFWIRASVQSSFYGGATSGWIQDKVGYATHTASVPVPVPTAWTYVELKGTATVTGQAHLVLRGSATVSPGYMEYSGIKVEKGNIATAWTPAPEDVDAAAAAAMTTANSANAAAGNAQGTANSALSVANNANWYANNWVRPGQTTIDGNKIYTGDAYVDTLQIRGQAVTVPILVTPAANQIIYPSWGDSQLYNTIIASASISIGIGIPVLLSFFGVFEYYAGNGYLRVILKRNNDGVVLYDNKNQTGWTVSLALAIQQIYATETYSIYASSSNDWVNNQTATFRQGALSLIGMKR